MSCPYKTGSHWDAAPVEYSSKTQALLKTMMQESKLTNLQQRNITRNVNQSGQLPGAAPPRSRKQNPPPLPKVLTGRNYTGQGFRSRDKIIQSGAYEAEPFRPRAVPDRSKEKVEYVDKLIYGADVVEAAKKAKSAPPRRLPSPEPEPDRFDELLAELADRRSFMERMESIGKGAKYKAQIDVEISQKIREMELIDKMASGQLEIQLQKAGFSTDAT